MVGAAVTWYGNWASVGGKERTRPRSFVEDRKSGGRRGEDKQLSTGSLLLSVVLLFSLVFSPPVFLPFPSSASRRGTLSPPVEKVTLLAAAERDVGHGPQCSAVYTLPTMNIINMEP